MDYAEQARALSLDAIFEGIPPEIAQRLQDDMRYYGPFRSGCDLSAALWARLPEEMLSRDSNVRAARICSRDEEIIRAAAWYLYRGGERLDEFVAHMDKVAAPAHTLDGQVAHRQKQTA